MMIRGILLTILVTGLLTGCGGSKKSKRLELTRQDLEVHQHVLVVGSGPALIKLDVGLAGKVLMKGLNHIMELGKNSSFTQSLREAGLLPRETAVENGVATLQELGWKVTKSSSDLESPGKKFKKVKLPAGLCEEATSSGADSVLILYERMTIDVGVTKALAKNELWAHFFACPEKELLWRGKDKRKLSLNPFIVAAAKQVVTKEKKVLADLLISLRKTTSESVQQLLVPATLVAATLVANFVTGLDLLCPETGQCMSDLATSLLT